MDFTGDHKTTQSVILQMSIMYIHEQQPRYTFSYYQSSHAYHVSIPHISIP